MFIAIKRLFTYFNENLILSGTKNSIFNRAINKEKIKMLHSYLFRYCKWYAPLFSKCIIP